VGVIRSPCASNRIPAKRLGCLYAEQLGCPDCLEVHEVSRIDAWVTDKAHPIRWQDEAVGGGG